MKSLVRSMLGLLKMPKPNLKVQTIGNSLGLIPRNRAERRGKKRL